MITVVLTSCGIPSRASASLETGARVVPARFGSDIGGSGRTLCVLYALFKGSASPNTGDVYGPLWVTYAGPEQSCIGIIGPRWTAYSLTHCVCVCHKVLLCFGLPDTLT